MIRLYDYLPSGNGYKVRLLLTQLAIPFERIRGHGDDAPLLVILQHFRRSRPLLFVEGTFEAALLVAMANLANGCGVKRITEEIRGALAP